MSLTSGGKFIAETLKGYGVTHMFFVPEVFLAVLDEAKKLNLKPVLAHSEKGAAYMADGYARASHRPGVCMAQSVGAANLAAGLQDAYLGFSPVIALTGRRPFPERYRNCYQEVDHAPLFAPVTKFSAAVENIDGLPFILRQAFREATSAAPGPVHLDFPGISGEILMRGTGDLELKVEKRFSSYPSSRQQPDPEAVMESARALVKAGKPVIVAGGGVTASRAQKEVVELAELLEVPVATSLNGKGTIPDNHPLSVGVVGSYSRVCANKIVSEADLVLFVGSRTGSQVTCEWRVPPPGTPVIQIDIDAHEPGRNYPTSLALVGDAKTSLKSLIEAVRSLKPQGQKSEWLQHARQLVDQWREGAAAKLNSEATPIRPERICREITELLPSNAILVACTGHAGIWSSTMVDLNYPGQSYLRAAGSLGWAVPAAIGAKCAAPDRPVVCFTGDGGFWYHLAELETAVRYGINTVTVINNNRALNQVGRNYPDHPENDDLWQFSNVNLSQMAQAMGCMSQQVQRPQELKSALQKALAADKPAVIEVISDIKAFPDPAWHV